MSDKEYHVVDVDLTEAEELKPDVHLEVAGVKLDLPNLNNAELPIELVQAILLVKSKPALCCARPNARSPTSPRPSRRGPTNPDWTQKHLPRPPLAQPPRGTSLRLDPSVRADIQARTLPGMG